jgi:hypothetical protein
VNTATPSVNGPTRTSAVMLLTVSAPFVAGVIAFGWRAILVIAAALACHFVASKVWRRITAEPDGGRVAWPERLVPPLLVAATLPAEAATIDRWPVIPAAMLLLAMLQSLRPRAGKVRIAPALTTIVLSHLLIGPSLVPHGTLQRSNAVVGDVASARLSVVPILAWHAGDRPAIDPEGAPQGAIAVPPVAQTIGAYLAGRPAVDFADPLDVDSAVTMDALLRSSLPPLDDVVALGAPAPIGMASLSLIIIAILYGSWRGRLDVRIPVIATSVAYLLVVLLPVPVLVERGERSWRWLAVLSQGVGADAAMTFVNYVVMGTPALFAAGLLANLGAVRPLRRRARIPWAVLLGALLAPSLLYLPPAWGPYAAVLIAGLLARGFDRLFAPRYHGFELPSNQQA